MCVGTHMGDHAHGSQGRPPHMGADLREGSGGLPCAWAQRCHRAHPDAYPRRPRAQETPCREQPKPQVRTRTPNQGGRLPWQQDSKKVPTLATFKNAEGEKRRLVRLGVLKLR